MANVVSNKYLMIALVIYLRIFIHHLFPVQVDGVFAGKTSVFRIEVLQLRKRRSHVRHTTSFRIQLPCQERV